MADRLVVMSEAVFPVSQQDLLRTTVGKNSFAVFLRPSSPFFFGCGRHGTGSDRSRCAFGLALTTGRGAGDGQQLSILSFPLLLFFSFLSHRERVAAGFASAFEATTSARPLRSARGHHAATDEGGAETKSCGPFFFPPFFPSLCPILGGRPCVNASHGRGYHQSSIVSRFVSSRI